MPRPRLLSSEELESLEQRLPRWTVNAGRTRLSRSYTCSSFIDAIETMTKVAPQIDALDHHPNWSNVYDKVSVELWTHDRGGLTELDLELAALLDRAFEALV